MGFLRVSGLAEPSLRNTLGWALIALASHLSSWPSWVVTVFLFYEDEFDDHTGFFIDVASTSVFYC